MSDMSPDALIPVGRSCDCGHPLVWLRGQQTCAVYGSHPAILNDGDWWEWDDQAPLAGLVRMCLDTPVITRRDKRRAPRLRAVS